jgi:hypothetical protein|nr:MAG TPA: hypothetical protein [Bacteriophage sp.]
MNKGAQIVSASIIGADFVNVMVNGRCYTVFPPTVHKLAGAGMFLSDFGDEQTVRDVISSINDSEKLAHAFSWLVQGNDGLFDELSHGTFDELVNAIDMAYSLISVENFTRLSTLAKNVASLIAKQR